MSEETRREMNDMRREYIEEKGYKVEEMWECDWCENLKTNDKMKNCVRTHFPYKRILATDILLARRKDASLFVYVQYDLVVPDDLKSTFQKHRGWKKQYWRLHEEFCNRERNVKTSSENADI